LVLVLLRILLNPNGCPTDEVGSASGHGVK